MKLDSFRRKMCIFQTTSDVCKVSYLKLDLKFELNLPFYYHKFNRFIMVYRSSLLNLWLKFAQQLTTHYIRKGDFTLPSID